MKKLPPSKITAKKKKYNFIKVIDLNLAINRCDILIKIYDYSK